MRTRMFGWIAVMALVLGLAMGTARADLIWIDFSDENGTAAGNWNVVTDAGVGLSNLTYSDGTASVVDLSFSGTAMVEADAQQGGSGSNTWDDDYAWVVDEASMDALVVTSATATVLFSDLDPTNLYTFEIGGTRARSDVDLQEGDYTISGSFSDNIRPAGDPENPNVAVSDDYNAGITNGGSVGDGETLHRLMVWNDVVPNGSGEITLSITGHTFGWLNFMQITETALVPEPAGLAFLGVALLGLRRRKRS